MLAELWLVDASRRTAARRLTRSEWPKRSGSPVARA